MSAFYAQGGRPIWVQRPRINTGPHRILHTRTLFTPLEIHMNKTFFAMLAATALSSTLALAQDRPPPPPDGRGPPDVAKLLNIDANRAEKVQAILRAAHEQRMALHKSAESGGQQTDRKTMREKLHALHEDTQKKLATVLTPDELKKLDAALPRPPMDGPPPQGQVGQGAQSTQGPGKGGKPQ